MEIAQRNREIKAFWKSMIFILKSQVFSNQYEAFVVFVFVYEAFEAKACPSEPS